MARSAKVLIYDPEGYALVLQRSHTHPYFALEADLPGGIVEQGETAATGLVRELREEISFELDEAALQPVASSKSLSTRELFVAHVAERPEVTLSWEHASYNWYTGDDLLKILVSGDPFVKLARDYIISQR